MNGWTAARLARQAQATRRWRPWEHATGPRTAEGKTRSARNADRGGHWRTDRLLPACAAARATSRAIGSIIVEDEDQEEDKESDDPPSLPTSSPLTRLITDRLWW